MNNQERNKFFVRSKHIQLTINKDIIKYYEEIKDYLINEKKATYFISCLEENKRNELHIHIYVQFNERIRLYARDVYHAHIEGCNGSTTDNQNYIIKIKKLFKVNNTLDEIGTPKMITSRKKGDKIKFASQLKGLPFEEVKISHYKIWKEVNLNKTLTPAITHKPDLKVYYLWGESGVGKSKKVFTELIGKDEQYDQVSFNGTFWDGVNTEEPSEIAVYDDFRPSDMKPSEFIKFIDKNVHPMNIKYERNWFNRYKRIYITSIFDPHEIYSSIPEEAKNQWLRRTEIIHVEENPYGEIN